MRLRRSGFTMIAQNENPGPWPRALYSDSL